MLLLWCLFIYLLRDDGMKFHCHILYNVRDSLKLSLCQIMVSFLFWDAYSNCIGWVAISSQVPLQSQ